MEDLIKTLTATLLIFISSLFLLKTDSKGGIQGTSEKVKLMTYNIYGYRIIHRKRTKALIDLIEDSGAHIIALQEAKPWFIKKLLNRFRIKKRYNHTPLRRGYKAKGDLFLLSSFPIKKSLYLMQPGRRNKIILMSKVVIDNEMVPIVNVHLESPLRSKWLRKRQLRKVFKKVRWYHNAIVLGDFNFGDSGIESSAIPGKFTDLWLSLKFKKNGYTWDMEKNILARNHAFKRETSRRLDRILVRHSTWKPVKIKLAGKKPIYSEKGLLFPSDHYALIGTIKSI